MKVIFTLTALSIAVLLSMAMLTHFAPIYIESAVIMAGSTCPHVELPLQNDLPDATELPQEEDYIEEAQPLVHDIYIDHTLERKKEELLASYATERRKNAHPNCNK